MKTKRKGLLYIGFVKGKRTFHGHNIQSLPKSKENKRLFVPNKTKIFIQMSLP